MTFVKLSHLQILIKWSHFNLMNSIHKMNVLNWHLFIIIIKNEYDNYLSYAHIIFSNKNENIIAEFLHTIKRWCEKWDEWQSKYFFIDDSAVKQWIIMLIFQNFIDEWWWNENWLFFLSHSCWMNFESQIEWF